MRRITAQSFVAALIGSALVSLLIMFVVMALVD
jgi:hypothetical protein